MHDDIRWRHQETKQVPFDTDPLPDPHLRFGTIVHPLPPKGNREKKSVQRYPSSPRRWGEMGVIGVMVPWLPSLPPLLPHSPTPTPPFPPSPLAPN